VGAWLTRCVRFLNTWLRHVGDDVYTHEHQDVSCRNASSSSTFTGHGASCEVDVCPSACKRNHRVMLRTLGRLTINPFATIEKGIFTLLLSFRFGGGENEHNDKRKRFIFYHLGFFHAFLIFYKLLVFS